MSSRNPALNSNADSLTISEAAKYLGVSEFEMRRLADRGAIACSRGPGRVRRFDFVELAAARNRRVRGQREQS